MSQVKSVCVIVWTESVPQEVGLCVEVWEWSLSWPNESLSVLQYFL